jgi:hypothetical protein
MCRLDHPFYLIQNPNFDSIHNTLTNKKYINFIHNFFASHVKIKKITHKSQTEPETHVCATMPFVPSPPSVTVVVALLRTGPYPATGPRARRGCHAPTSPSSADLYDRIEMSRTTVRVP